MRVLVRECGTGCHVQVMPRNQLEAGTAKLCFYGTESRIASKALIEFRDNCLVIQGLGFDGRCSFCRYFRLELKRKGIACKVDCPFEVRCSGEEGGCMVEIGGRYFHQDSLENGREFYLQHVRENPHDVQGHLMLGVILEYQGQFAEALSTYWRAYELDASDEFIRGRLKEILEFLVEIMPDS